jgi:hypothetical protein
MANGPKPQRAMGVPRGTREFWLVGAERQQTDEAPK